MATLLRMPEVAANATHAVLIAWTCEEGDAVAAGDCIAEIETDKATVELNAESAGTLGRTLVSAGQQVEVGAPIGVLLSNGETHAEIDALIASAAGITAPQATTLAIEAPRPADVGIAARAQRIFASPLARRLAGQRNVDLSTLTGSGPNGRIVRRDIEGAAVDSSAVAPTSVSQSADNGVSHQKLAEGVPTNVPQAITTSAGYIEIPHTGMRRTIARRLTESKSMVPHFYLTADCQVDRLLALRAEINAGATRKTSVNDFVVRAVAVAFRKVPGTNVAWTETALRRFDAVDVSVAVSTESGLITPIVRAADTKSLSTISSEIASLAERARAGQLRPDEYQGGSISVSNLGMYGVSEFSAIINPPQAAILAVGAAQPTPVVRDGEVSVATIVRCTLSVDHRAIDGALAAQWLAAFRRLMENPLSMLV